MYQNKNENGFSTIEFIMVFLIIVLVGAVGYFVYKNHHQPVRVITVTKTVTKPSATNTTSSTTNPYANWKTYTSATGKYTIKYPETWTLNECSGDALIGATSAEAGTCQSDSTPQIQISSMAGDERQNWQIIGGPAYPDLNTTTVTINGTESIKQTATLSAGSNNTTGGIPDGTKVTNYIFYVNGRTYLFAYNQKPAGTDISIDANLIVTKTLTFNQ